MLERSDDILLTRQQSNYVVQTMSTIQLNLGSHYLYGLSTRVGQLPINLNLLGDVFLGLKWVEISCLDSSRLVTVAFLVSIVQGK